MGGVTGIPTNIVSSRVEEYQALNRKSDEKANAQVLYGSNDGSIGAQAKDVRQAQGQQNSDGLTDRLVKLDPEGPFHKLSDVQLFRSLGPKQVTIDFSVSEGTTYSKEEYSRKTGDRVGVYERAYRESVDAEAKKHGLSWAEGHLETSQYPFSKVLAVGNAFEDGVAKNYASENRGDVSVKDFLASEKS